MYVGRILQGISGTGAWIIGFAMITDAAGSQNIGKALGFSGSFITAGIITGPAIAGVLLDFFGYWVAWSVPLLLLVIDFIARLAMVEESSSTSSQSNAKVTRHGSCDEQQQSTALLHDSPAHDTAAAEESKHNPSRGFYSLMFRQGSVYAALLNVTAFALIVSGFDATLPIHLRDTFGWSSAPIGSIFLALQIPAMFLAPAVGWLRDRIGLRYPVTLGWVSSQTIC